MSDIQVGAQPAACPICGWSSNYRSLHKHLTLVHRLDGRPRLNAMHLVWREIQVGLLEVTRPQWEGP